MGWTVLCVSKNSPAQHTRNLILERAGYRVVSTDDPNEAVRIFAALQVHGVVVGDSISADIRVTLTQTLKRLKQAIPIIVLNNTSGTQMPSGMVDEQLESLGDPRLLLEALVRVLPVDGLSKDGHKT